MILKVRYYDHGKGQTVSLDIPADVLDVSIPAHDNQPAVEVTVNTDAVFVRTDNKVIGGHEYSDLLAEAASEL